MALRRLFRWLIGGGRERLDAAVRQRMVLWNQSLPKGPMKVVLQEVGENPVEAVKAVHRLTGLDLHEAAVLVARLLPFTIMEGVSVETAEAARDLLVSLGAAVEVIDMSPCKERPQQAKKPAWESVVSLPDAVAEVGDKGSYVVVLEDVGLLSERIGQIVQQLTGWTMAEVETAVSQLPYPLFLDLSEEDAYRVQQELQMFGAVVSVLPWEIYECSSPNPRSADADQPEAPVA